MSLTTFFLNSPPGGAFQVFGASVPFGCCHMFCDLYRFHSLSNNFLFIIQYFFHTFQYFFQLSESRPISIPCVFCDLLFLEPSWTFCEGCTSLQRLLSYLMPLSAHMLQTYPCVYFTYWISRMDSSGFGFFLSSVSNDSNICCILFWLLSLSLLGKLDPKPRTVQTISWCLRQLY